jgi:hypothetical protein
MSIYISNRKGDINTSCGIRITSITAKLEVPTRAEVFWDVMTCRLLEGYTRFECSELWYCIYLQDQDVQELLGPEDEGIHYFETPYLFTS